MQKKDPVFDLFGKIPTAPATPAAADVPPTTKSLQVKAVAAKLSPAQQRFNKLLSRVENLTTQCETLQAQADKYRPAYHQTQREIEHETQQVQKEMLKFLHGKLQQKGLTAAQQRYAQTIVKDLLQVLEADSDPALAALFAHYFPPEAQAQMEEDAQEAMESLRQELEELLGRALPELDKAQTPEEMMAFAAQQAHAQMAQDEERRQAKRAKRAQKQPTQRQQQAQQQALDAQTALRTIFRQLASALHPDRETDPQERERKTTLMSRVNAAYERKDLNALLRLQLQVAQIDEASIARMADDKLSALSLLLKEQVAQLEAQVQEQEMRLSHEFRFAVDARMPELVWQRTLARQQADMRAILENMQDDLRRVQSEAELKRWLKEQNALAKQHARMESMLYGMQDMDMEDDRGFYP